MSGIGNHTTGVQNLRRYIDAAERKALDPVGLTTSQFDALDTLARNPGASASELADLLHVSRQNTHMQMVTLVERGLVERWQPGAARGKGRPQPLKLTPAGRSALRKARTRAGRVDAAFAAAYGPDQLAELQRLLAIGMAALADRPALAAQA
jgi:DNA-binding MarR family transcriptional regulator